MPKEIVDVGFLFPVINGKLYVGQRGTEPYKDMYGPIGGKSEKHNPHEAPYIKDYPAKPHIPSSDVLSEIKDKEFGHTSAIREFYEEAFRVTSVPWSEVSNIFKIGRIEDLFNGTDTNCQFYLAMIQRGGFHLSPRELQDISPLTEIEIHQLYPLAKASLYGLKKAFDKGIIKKLEPYSLLSVDKQIPSFDIAEIAEIMHGRSTSIEGLHD
ncbi:MAG TPA: hypothetical protein VL401_02945 [Alphaproteobacteria bacterium]|jgi:hypothetical protein|nr:hypothetical protein [Alphaproteobacteria bacterium]